MIALGIDTSNYATSLALYDSDSGQVLGDVKTFLPVEEGQLGLRQSDAVFHHTKQLPLSLQALASIHPLQHVQAVGVSTKPRSEKGSYMPCFLTGYTAALYFAGAKGLPVVQTTHQQGHVMAALYGSGKMDLLRGPLLVFHISGGTTDLLLVKGLTSIVRIGGSADLYAGQAVDRLGGLLGYPFPSGTYISAMAEEWPEPVKVTPSVNGMHCHLSGLENQYKKMLADGQPAPYITKYCLTYIAASVEKLVSAARQVYGPLPVVAAGGVMSSLTIADYLTARINDIAFAPAKYSSDNAIGNAIIAAGGV